MSAYSIVEYLADHDGYKCGYCGSKDTNFSRGMWAHSMTCEDYQDLIDRGWRRSGKYVYKPTMNRMCCPSYTIRCEALRFKATKSQKKILKRFTRYLMYDEKPRAGGGAEGKQCSDDKDISDEVASPSQNSERQLADRDVKGLDSSAIDASAIINDKTKEKRTETSQSGETKGEGSSKTQQPDKVHVEKKQPKPGLGSDPSKPACKKAKQLRLERKQQRLAQRQETTNATETSKATKRETSAPKCIEELIVDSLPGQEPKHKLEIRLVRSSPRSPEFQDTFAAEYALYKKYQITIHKDPPTKPTERQFTRFLVDSPLQPDDTEDAPECGYGSFHQQYWLDGKLIAVGVIDLLPHCVSSVYLFYDPDYQFLNLGTYSALR
ncbi:arginyl-tRNA--protein transferase 1-like [Amphiura filiformis]|uniref:arginyl-tRNA--protein transferase 1-like n=1 Tax=Amphiura filiformis TaxID=82378 RepID=UPI003B22400D